MDLKSSASAAIDHHEARHLSPKSKSWRWKPALWAFAAAGLFLMYWFDATTHLGISVKRTWDRGLISGAESPRENLNGFAWKDVCFVAHLNYRNGLIATKTDYTLAEA